MVVRGGRELRFVVHFALQRSGAQIEGIAGREADFDHAAVIFQAIRAVGQEFAVEKDVAVGGLRANVVAAHVDEAEIAADGGNFDAARAAQALERAVHGLDGEIAGGVLEIHARGDGFDVHIAEDVRDVHAARIVVNLQFGILGDADFIIGAQVVRRDGRRKVGGSITSTRLPVCSASMST